jgi:hypothetical protein
MLLNVTDGSGDFERYQAYQQSVVAEVHCHNGSNILGGFSNSLPSPVTVPSILPTCSVEEE